MKNKPNQKAMLEKEKIKEQEIKAAAIKDLEEEKKIGTMYKKHEKDEEVIDHKILNQIYPEVHYTDVTHTAQEGNNRINLVIIGHVDSGKSTLMGHILYKMGRVDQ